MGDETRRLVECAATEIPDRLRSAVEGILKCRRNLLRPVTAERHNEGWRIFFRKAKGGIEREEWVWIADVAIADPSFDLSKEIPEHLSELRM